MSVGDEWSITSLWGVNFKVATRAILHKEIPYNDQDSNWHFSSIAH